MKTSAGMPWAHATVDENGRAWVATRGLWQDQDVRVVALMQWVAHGAEPRHDTDQEH